MTSSSLMVLLILFFVPSVFLCQDTWLNEAGEHLILYLRFHRREARLEKSGSSFQDNREKTRQNEA
jgi:hypothetical protein